MREFALRFGREAEGMWLPETAVDLPTLESLAACGIRFTILGPHQAAATRPLAGGEWQDVSGGRIDTGVPYLTRLPSGREIALFFYDTGLSRAVAFERLLGNGDEFARRILAAFPAGVSRPYLVSLATDGETFGHHHRFGEMALAYSIERIASGSRARFTNYGEHLSRFPPLHEVRILENTSWSCAHGLGRWREDCGCRLGRGPGWTQGWRKPLREALDQLREDLAAVYEREASSVLADPWQARDRYIAVVVARSPESLAAFLEQNARGALDASHHARVVALLEMQRQALLMYASCGWFFDDISGLESVQVLRHAGRALQLAAEISGGSFEHAFLAALERAPSNVAEIGNGRAVYERHVRR
jgi:alpha-amylase/alpha-mannosidase (GH57 family)